MGRDKLLKIKCTGQMCRNNPYANWATNHYHECPYERDLNNEEKLCRCCKDCTRMCALDI